PTAPGLDPHALSGDYRRMSAACGRPMTHDSVLHCRYYAERCTHGPWRLRSARGFSRRSVTMTTTTRTSESTAPSVGLLLAFELGQRSWKVGFTVGIGQRPRIRQIPAGAVSTLVAEIERAKQPF